MIWGGIAGLLGCAGLVLVGLVCSLAVSGIGAGPRREMASAAGTWAGVGNAPPTFYKDVLPILQEHCQRCHRPGEIGPMALQTYGKARKYAGAIRSKTERRIMPPWFADPRFERFTNNPSLTDGEIAVIARWVYAGTPAGNRRDAPGGPHWSVGWNIPAPDNVVTMPTAVKIPAHGEV